MLNRNFDLLPYSTPTAYYMIHSGQLWDLMVEHMKAREEQLKFIRTSMKKELGLGDKDRLQVDDRTGRILAISWEDRLKVHPDFKAPDRRWASYPKKGSAWAKALDRQFWTRPEETVENLGLFPGILDLKWPDGGESSQVLCPGTSHAGFLWMSKDGPFCVWCPDYPQIIRFERARGNTVIGDVATWRKPAGLVKITHEDWQYECLCHEYEKATAEKEKRDAAKAQRALKKVKVPA